MNFLTVISCEKIRMTGLFDRDRNVTIGLATLTQSQRATDKHRDRQTELLICYTVLIP